MCITLRHLFDYDNSTAFVGCHQPHYACSDVFLWDHGNAIFWSQYTYHANDISSPSAELWIGLRRTWTRSTTCWLVSVTRSRVFIPAYLTFRARRFLPHVLDNRFINYRRYHSDRHRSSMVPHSCYCRFNSLCARSNVLPCKRERAQGMLFELFLIPRCWVKSTQYLAAWQVFSVMFDHIFVSTDT